MAKKISVSFKETEKDIKLFVFLKSLDDMSADIKAALRDFYKDQLRDFYKNKLNEKDAPVEDYVKKADEEVNVLDF